MDNSTNATEDPESFGWSHSVIPLLLIFPIALILNSATFSLILYDKKLHTAFNIYLANLFGANILYALLNGPLECAAGLSAAWQFSESTCTTYIYLQCTLAVVQQSTHVLIAINRFWAITHAVHYRKHHNVKIALTFCLLIWIIAHSSVVPVVALNTTFYQEHLRNDGCIVYEGSWASVWMFGVQTYCSICVLATLILLPFLCCRIWHRRKNRKRDKKNGVIPLSGCHEPSTSGH